MLFDGINFFFESVESPAMVEYNNEWFLQFVKYRGIDGYS